MGRKHYTIYNIKTANALLAKGYELDYIDFSKENGRVVFKFFYDDLAAFEAELDTIVRQLSEYKKLFTKQK